MIAQNCEVTGWMDATCATTSTSILVLEVNVDRTGKICVIKNYRVLSHLSNGAWITLTGIRDQKL